MKREGWAAGKVEGARVGATHNNNPNVPGNSVNGLAGAVPVGSGAILGGTEYIELYRNRIVHNHARGVWITDSPYQGNPPPGIGQHCQGGIYINPPPPPEPTCYFQGGVSPSWIEAAHKRGYRP